MSDLLSPFMKGEVSELLTHVLIGRGSSRDVYETLFVPDVVIKVESGVRSFHNTIEWEVWKSIQHTEFAKWFAPCVAISATGSVLVQKRTEPAYQYPERIPAFFTDIKGANWGMYEGRFVCHDYGCNLLLERGMTKAMRKVNWQTESRR